MGLITGLLGLPLAPLRGTVAVAEQIRQQAEDDFYDPHAIRAQLAAYATTLHNRDFAGFDQLWAKDAEFFGGTGNTAKGPAAIRDLLRGLLGKNGAPAPGRDFHLVMNQTVDVSGDTATGFSRGTWVSTNAENRLQVTIIANYYDRFVREDGRWKFKRHQIGGAPPPAITAP